MIYAEAAYFDGDHCQHVADREDTQRRARLAADSRREIRANGRGR